MNKLISTLIPYLVLFVFGFYSGKWFGAIIFCLIYYFLVKNVKITYTKYKNGDLDSDSNNSSYYNQNNELANAYKVLEISESSSLDDIKKARNRLIKKYHPDKVSSNDKQAKKQANEKVILINQAYEIISKFHTYTK